MNLNSQYETPLTGPEQIRLRAIELVSAHSPSSTQWVEQAKAVEEYIIGQRATDMQKRIDDAHRIAWDLRHEAEMGSDPWTDAPERVEVALAKVRELEQMLSNLAEVPF